MNKGKNSQHASAQGVSRRTLLLAAVAGGLSFSAATVVSAQDGSSYPSRPIRLIVPFAAGGPNDIAARLIAPALREKLGQALVITNIPGAGGRIGSRAATRAEPDGYTLMVGGTNLNVVLPASHRNLDYDPVGDFVPVAAFARDEMLVAINPALPVRSVAEFAEYSKKRPNSVSAGAAPGIGPHFAIEMFRRRAGADVTFIPYKGAAPAITDVVAGHIQMTITNKAVLLPFVQKGQLRALAVTSSERMPELPETPTLRESGVLGVPSTNWYGIFVPKGTPEKIVATLKEAVRLAARAEKTQDMVRRAGLEPYDASRDFAEILAEQRREWAVIVKETGISLD